MRVYVIRWGGSLFPLLLALLMFAGCGSTPSAQGSTNTTTPTPQITPTPTLPTVPTKKVEFTTEDKVKIAGLIYGNGGTTAIICSHQTNGDKELWSDIAPWFAAKGFLVLAYDFRGYGDSGGNTDWSKAHMDTLAAIKFMQSQGAKKIVLLGASIGGEISLVTAAKTDVAAVISLSGGFFGELTEAQFKSITEPKLIVNSEEDEYIDDTKKMIALAQAPMDSHIYSGRAHGVAIFIEDRQDLVDRILGFISKYVAS